MSYNDIGNFGAERLAGVLGQCAALAYLNLSSKAEIRDRWSHFRNSVKQSQHLRGNVS
jgi:hypothetical protein